jgi:hypothetical protein
MKIVVLIVRLLLGLVFFRLRPETHLQLGDNLTVYYISQGRKYSITESDGKIHKYVANDNLIFKIMLLPPPKTKH